MEDLTEISGNNAVEMETTATYDPATQEFIIHTPRTLAQKYWITNSAGKKDHETFTDQINENHIPTWINM